MGLDFSRYLLGGASTIQEKCDSLKQKQNQAAVLQQLSTERSQSPFLQGLGLSLGGPEEGSSVPE